MHHHHHHITSRTGSPSPCSAATAEPPSGTHRKLASRFSRTPLHQETGSLQPSRTKDLLHTSSQPPVFFITRGIASTKIKHASCDKLTLGLELVFVSPGPARSWTHKRRHSRSYFSRLGPLSTTNVPLSSLGTGRSPASLSTQAPDPRPRDKNASHPERDETRSPGTATKTVLWGARSSPGRGSVSFSQPQSPPPGSPTNEKSPRIAPLAPIPLGVPCPSSASQVQARGGVGDADADAVLLLHLVLASIPRKNFAFLYQTLDLAILPSMLLLAQLSHLVAPPLDVMLCGLSLTLVWSTVDAPHKETTARKRTKQPSSSLTSATLLEGGVQVPAELTPVIEQMIKWVSAPTKNRPRTLLQLLPCCLGVGGCRTQTDARRQS